jgi:hypothetical protein
MERDSCKFFTRFISSLTFCVLTVPSLARADSTCPLTIAVEQKASSPTADWTVTYSKYPTELAQVTIFNGPPKELASLVPDDEKKSKTEMIQTWELPKDARGYWLQCDYANTTAGIYRQLPATATRCRVTYDLIQHFGDGRWPIKSVKCTP